MNTQDEKFRRWRLILGKETEENFTGTLSTEDLLLDEALSSIYDNSSDTLNAKSAGKGKPSPYVAKWLSDIRSLFSADIVSVIQNDAIEKKGLKQLLIEPEVLKSIEPDISIVSTLIALKNKIPDKSKETAREVVRKVVEQINKRLASELRMAVTGSLNKKQHSPIPSAMTIDYKYTIQKNLKNYNTELKSIIPDRIYYFGRNQIVNKWTIILDMDQSGSMSDSLIYGTVAGCIFASMSSLKTHVITFDTEVVNLTETCGSDPVDMLFGIQLGGGTDINKSVAYCETLITEPAKTIFILLTDLYEGGNQSSLLKRLENIKASGVKCMVMLALSDNGKPSYNEVLANKISAMQIPCFYCTPNHLPELIEKILKSTPLN